MHSLLSLTASIYCIYTKITNKTNKLSCFSTADSVFLQSEDLRTEYVKSDIGLLFKGSPGNIDSRPWSFDQVRCLTIDWQLNTEKQLHINSYHALMCFQYEKGILDICMKLLQLSPQHQADMGKDLQNRSNPVYISRVISAMVRICSHSLLSALSLHVLI